MEQVGNFIFAEAGRHFLVIPPEVVQVILARTEELHEAMPDLHRTPVEEMSGDVLDRLDLEMVNDSVVAQAETELRTTSTNMLLIFKKIDELGIPFIMDLAHEDTHLFLMWFNQLYVSSRSEEIEKFTIGSGQAFGDFLEFSQKPVEEMTPKELEVLYLSTLVNELSEVLFLP